MIGHDFISHGSIKYTVKGLPAERELLGKFLLKIHPNKILYIDTCNMLFEMQHESQFQRFKSPITLRHLYYILITPLDTLYRDGFYSGIVAGAGVASMIENLSKPLLPIIKELMSF
jgi:hypothetical protein